MLVLSRKIGERVCIGKTVVVTVVAVNNGKVRLAFNAPEYLSIDREEVRDRKFQADAGPDDEGDHERGIADAAIMPGSEKLAQR